MRGGRGGRLPAAILAGGGSRRMGRDKAFVEYGGVPMIERVIGVLAPLAAEVVIIANDVEKYSSLGLPVHRDVEPGMGPLSGLYTAFAATGAAELLLAACDMPRLSPRMAEFVLSQAAAPGEAVIPVIGGVEQGLFAIYRRRAVERFEDRIKNRSIQFDEFRKSLDKSLIAEEDLCRVEPDLISFLNVNRPEDLLPGGP